MRIVFILSIIVIIVLALAFYFGFLWHPKKAEAPVDALPKIDNGGRLFEGPPAGAMPGVRGPTAPPPVGN